MPRPRTLYILLLSLMAIGCLDDEKAEGVDGRDTATGDWGAPWEAAPDIELSAEMLSLPAVPVGDQSTEILTVTNRGDEDLRLQDITVSGAHGFEATLSGAPHLGPGDSTDLIITFAPSHTDLAEAELSVNSNDPDEPDARVQLMGMGTGPQPETDSEVVLGVAALGCTTTGEVPLWNSGTSAFTVEGLEIPPPFSVDASVLPLLVAAGDTVALAVTYTPTEPMSEQMGSLAIETDAGDLALQVVGTQAPATWTEDLFVARDASTDVLFALDRSCSMYEEVAALVSAMPGFTTELDARGLDWRISVTVDDDGCIEGSDLYIDSSFASADVAAVTSGMINFGASYGANSERPFTLMEAAVEASGTGGCNSGLLRNESTINLVSMSDESEQSVEPYSHYVAEFQALKASAADVSMHAVVGTGGCGSTGSLGGFEDAATATGGVLLDLCGDMVANLDTLADALVVSDAASYHLSGTPVEETLQVTVDGAAAVGWSHDPIQQRIVFSPGTTPEDGQRVTVDYAEDACP